MPIFFHTAEVIMLQQIELGEHMYLLDKASTTYSLDLYADFMGSVVGQASFLFHISQQFLPILEG